MKRSWYRRYVRDVTKCFEMIRDHLNGTKAK